MIEWSSDLEALKLLPQGTEVLLKLDGWEYHGNPAESGIVHVKIVDDWDAEYRWSIMNDADGGYLGYCTGWTIKAWSHANTP